MPNEKYVISTLPTIEQLQFIRSKCELDLILWKKFETKLLLFDHFQEIEFF